MEGAKKLNPKFNDLESVNTFKNHIDEVKNSFLSKENNKGFFIVNSANKWIQKAKNQPIQKMLFSQFWYENEICILFADTNLGKSILSVQIGDSISKGKAIEGFIIETDKQPVLYFDFELSTKQFEIRYAEINERTKKPKSHYEFDSNFKRVEINPDTEIPKGTTFEEYLSQSIEKCVLEHKAKVLIIDNLTYLNNETEKAREASMLIKGFK